MTKKQVLQEIIVASESITTGTMPEYIEVMDMIRNLAYQERDKEDESQFNKLNL